VNPAAAPTEALCDEEYVLPSIEALMAGTLALMTGYAQAADTCTHRPLMAKKLVSNLFFLANHPQVSPTMRCMLGNLRRRWQLALESGSPLAPTPPATWVAAPDTVQ
jgi:hypothetical protein